MKNLKKFQAFALTQEEQKNVTGGLLDQSRWTCYVWVGDSPSPAGSFGSVDAAAAWCRNRASCAGCF